MLNIRIKKYLHKVLSLGQIATENSKIQIEVEKLKWDLKKKYQEIGEYVTKKKQQKSTSDFSQDTSYIQKIDEVIKLKLYIEERIKEKKIL